MTQMSNQVKSGLINQQNGTKLSSFGIQKHFKLPRVFGVSQILTMNVIKLALNKELLGSITFLLKLVLLSSSRDLNQINDLEGHNI